MGKEKQKVNTERQRQRYSKDFKLAAVQLLQSGIILHVGFPYKTVYQWLAGQRMMALPFFI